MKKVLIIAILMTLTNVINAKEVCWCKFEVFSQNKQYVASIAPADNSDANPNWKSDWRIKVYKIEGNNKNLLWESKYAYSGKSAGILSEDGQYFTYVENWHYKDKPLLTIYKNGQKISSDIDGSSFSIARRKLKKTPLHFLWLSQFDVPYQYIKAANDQILLVVRTIDAREFTINLDHGTFVKKS